MPELPDVEVFRKYLENKALHQSIKKMEVLAKNILDNVSEQQLQSRVEGYEFESADRHGKYLFVKLSGDDHIVFHFGMTGYFDYSKNGEIPKHTRATFSFDNGNRLSFVLQRKLGKITLTKDIESFVKKQNLGPDILKNSFDLEVFKKAIKGAKGSIKSVLMNQSRLAGIGNIYSDEILFQARIYPTTKASELDYKRIRIFFEAIKEVLKTAIEKQADPNRMPQSYLLPNRHEGGKYPMCGGKLKSEKISGRTAYYCPECQH
jgi:formamidopyrimidine-DNA glycosylase